MSQDTRVKQDEIGLFVIAGGWIGRPRQSTPTRFSVGDLVRSHHFGGTPTIGVGPRGTKFNRAGRGSYEIWNTTVLTNYTRTLPEEVLNDCN